MWKGNRERWWDLQPVGSIVIITISLTHSLTTPVNRVDFLLQNEMVIGDRRRETERDRGASQAGNKGWFTLYTYWGYHQHFDNLHFPFNLHETVSNPPVEVNISGCSLLATVCGVPKLVTRIATTTWCCVYNRWSPLVENLCSIDKEVDDAANKDNHPTPTTLDWS